MLLSYLILFIMMLSVELLQLLLVRIPAFFRLNHYLLSPPRPDLDLNDRDVCQLIAPLQVTQLMDDTNYHPPPGDPEICAPDSMM